MDVRIQNDTSNIDWDLVAEILQKVGMASHSSEIIKKAFEKSYATVFIFDENKLIGFGRAISDESYQAAIYDVAVAPEYQGKGIGHLIMSSIIARIPNCNVTLYSSVGKERFYERENFKKMKTGMALFIDSHKMKDKGFTE